MKFVKDSPPLLEDALGRIAAPVVVLILAVVLAVELVRVVRAVDAAVAKLALQDAEPVLAGRLRHGAVAVKLAAILLVGAVGAVLVKVTPNEELFLGLFDLIDLDRVYLHLPGMHLLFLHLK